MTDKAGRSARILLVDDEPRNVRLLAAILGPLGYDTVTASGGRETLETLEREPIDLVLLDVAMPEVDGLAVLRTVRSWPDERYVPVVLVTAQSEHAMRLTGLEAGADDFLEKPIDRLVLVARVKSLVRWKAAQEELRERNAALEQLQKQREELTQFLVHDLKNPIGVVSANLSYVEMTSSPTQIDLLDAVHDAQDATLRVTTMVEDLLTIAKMERAEADLKLDTFRLAELVADVSRSQARNLALHGVKIESTVDPGIELRADRTLIRRVLENLADNAARYTPSGGRLGFFAHANEWIEIDVANTGKPIPVDLRTKIFEKFFRGAGAGRCNVGLGLHFCHRVVEAHGGEIRVIETPEWPAMFAIRLPAERTAQLA